MKPLIAVLLSAACAAAQADPFAPVAWLAGCWSQQGREAGSVEHWMAPAGGVMLGMARMLKNGRVVEFEFMQIRADADGRLSFVAQPQGRPPTAFPLLRQAEAEAVFENPAHDFPQRVLYRREAADRLVARIEGRSNGQERGIDFPMQRTACP
ncbi:DUF6265 family protein [Roseateles sp.]|uniref:DUF6265 family protein n=1 Tax=Roseateles sp. TaxID=1971397 RepID=UPI0025D6A415|nr:DUF6265 family protein [Roseateles sp.]MBV8035980.1 hypothetical protein [Roseateles sp.]